MPYLNAYARHLVERDGPSQPGDLNYLVTRLMLQALSRVLSEVHEAECEFRRRMLAPYEDAKILQNGDVYG